MQLDAARFEVDIIRPLAGQGLRSTSIHETVLERYGNERLMEALRERGIHGVLYLDLEISRVLAYSAGTPLVRFVMPMNSFSND